MKIYDIHFCRFDELKDLQIFIHQHWRKNHVLSYSKQLFDFQYQDKGLDHYNFVIARNSITTEIDGIYGFIRAQKYDQTCKIPNIGWGAIWKVRDDVENKEIGKLGLKMLNFIIKNGNIDDFAALGLSDIHKQIATMLNCKVGEMNHYYLINNNIKDFKIAFNPQFSKINSTLKNLSIQITNNIDDISLTKNINIYKNVSYFFNRYQNHPFFNYEFWKIYNNTTCLAIFAVRKIDIENSCIYRIIDMIGDIPEGFSLYLAFQDILTTHNAEYVDCLNYGLSQKFFLDLGFQLAPFDNSTIIPEHLDPLEHEYVPLEFECMSDRPLIIFKGDGDQDRPNKV